MPSLTKKYMTRKQYTPKKYIGKCIKKHTNALETALPFISQ